MGTKSHQEHMSESCEHFSEQTEVWQLSWVPHNISEKWKHRRGKKLVENNYCSAITMISELKINFQVKWWTDATEEINLCWSLAKYKREKRVGQELFTTSMGVSQ